MYLWDTNIASAAMAEHPAVVRHLAEPGSRDTIAISSITRGEILYGIERLPQGKRRDALAAKAAGLFAWVACVDVDERVADAYAEVRSAIERAGKPIGKENDLWIAAAASAHGCVLVSDQGSFEHVTGLPVENWLA